MYESMIEVRNDHIELPKCEEARGDVDCRPYTPRARNFRFGIDVVLRWSGSRI